MKSKDSIHVKRAVKTNTNSTIHIRIEVIVC